MKTKLFKRSATLALSLVLMCSLIPLGASAHTSDVYQGGYFREDPKFSDVFWIKDYKPMETGNKKVTINKDTFGEFCDIGGTLYEFAGIGLVPKDDNVKVEDGKASLDIPVMPKDPVKRQEWIKTYASVIVGYTPHQHDVRHAPVFADNNNHWKVCLKCQREIGMNWHHDVDNDGVCDECHQPIFYRYVTVKDAPGGKVEISKDKCMLNNRVNITVTPDEGYKLADIRGINNNDRLSIRPCIVDQKGSQYHMIVDVWDVEIQPTFVKE